LVETGFPPLQREIPYGVRPERTEFRTEHKKLITGADTISEM